MSGKIIRRSLDEPRSTGSGSDWERLPALTDEEIDAAVAADPDAPPLVDRAWFQNARLTDPGNMETVALSLDKDVTAWLREQQADFSDRPGPLGICPRARCAIQRPGRQSTGQQAQEAPRRLT